MTKSLLETDIFNYKTPEFYINMKNIPDKTSQERKSFVLEEKRKGREGININGIKIPGSLYFHLNYYHLQGDDLTTGKKSVFLPRLRDNEWIFFNDYEEAYINKHIYTYFGLRQAGKALRHGSKVYYENTIGNIEDCKVGDKIYGDNGELTTVLGVYPQGLKDIYRITLYDGRTVDCSEDHLWTLFTKKTTKKDRKGLKQVTLSTKELLTKYFVLRKDSHIKDKYVQKKEFLYSLPKIEPLSFKTKDIPIDPYFLGLWLGDGHERSASITTIDEEIKNYVYSFAEKRSLKVSVDNLSYRITSQKHGGNNKELHLKNPLLNDLKGLNLINNKHIPHIYLYSSIEQRLELLKGLMDSDGSVYNDGEITFTSSNPILADNFEFLCRSLGINLSRKIKKSGYKKNGIYVPCKESHYFNIFTDLIIFKLKRKIERLRNFNKELTSLQRAKIDKTRIVNIEYLGKDLATCITVDNKSHLFLTDNFIPTHNSEMEASLCLREISLFKETEAIALFSRQPDKDTFVKKMSTAISHGEKFMIVPNIDKDWSKEEIRFGLTKVDNTTDLRGRLYIYNTQEGKKIQIGSGKTPSFMLMDEIAISPFRGVYDVLEPALLSDSGQLRCSPIFTFTGGETEKAKDAENFVKYPNKDNQFITTLDDGKEIGGRFMSGLYRKDCKFETNLSNYLGKVTNTWLDDYPIYVSDFEIAEKKIEKEKEEALKSPDSNTYLLKRIFFPLNLDDVFLTESNNKFPKEVIEQTQTYLREHYEPLCVDLYRDMAGKPAWKYSDKKPLNKFPIKPSDNKEAPVCIYEHPIKDVPYGTYCIGIDPVNNNESNDKIVSLFTVKVYKRMLSPLDEYRNDIVCSYRGRPKELSEAHEIALLIAEYYNAVGSVLPEASENSIFQYFFHKRKGHFLADSFDLVSDISKGRTKWGGKKGLPPTTVNQRHYMNIMIEDANREDISITEEGDEELKYGVSRIKDIMLLEEMKQYKGKTAGKGVHDGNYDSIISYGCALTLAKYFDVKHPISSGIPQPKKQETVNTQSKFKNTFFGRFEKTDTSFKPERKTLQPTKLPSWMRTK